MQNLIVLFVVLAACFYIGGRLFRSFRSGTSSGGCSDCGDAGRGGTGCVSDCSSKQKSKINNRTTVGNKTKKGGQ